MNNLDSLLNAVAESAYSVASAPLPAQDTARPRKVIVNERLANALGTLCTALALVAAVIVLQP